MVFSRRIFPRRHFYIKKSPETRLIKKSDYCKDPVFSEYHSDLPAKFVKLTWIRPVIDIMPVRISVFLTDRRKLQIFAVPCRRGENHRAVRVLTLPRLKPWDSCFKVHSGYANPKVRICLTWIPQAFVAMRRPRYAGES